MEIFGLSENSRSLVFIITPLLIKISAAPFHRWLPKIVIFSKPKIALLLLTLQKIIPFMLFILNKPILRILLLMTLNLSCLIGPILNWSQNFFHSIIMFSSISHTGWLILRRLISQEIWLFYFTIYTVTIRILFWISPIISTQFKIKENLNISIVTFVLFLTLGGIPPLIGFFPKIILLSYSIKIILVRVVFILLLSSICDFFIYTRLSFFSIIIKKTNIIWNPSKKKIINIVRILIIINLTACTILYRI